MNNHMGKASFCPFVLPLGTLLVGGCSEDWFKKPPRVVEGKVYDASTMRHACIPIPKTAKDILIERNGVNSSVRCTVSEEDFLDLARKKGWNLHTDTASYDERTKRDLHYDLVGFLLSRLNPQSGGRLPTRFYSYNYVQTNYGGWFVLYDRDTGILVMERAYW